MKVDYSKYPEIPAGCQLNYNKTFDLYQVFREQRVIDPETGKKKVVRETIGSIRNGVFKPGETYRLRTENAELKKKLEKLTARVNALPQTGADVLERAGKVRQKVSSAIKTASLDKRNQDRVKIPMESIALPALMCALTGDTDAEMIADYTRVHADFFKRYLPEIHTENISHDTVRTNLMLVEPEKFESFYLQIANHLIKQASNRVIAADGQAVKATGRRTSQDPTLHETRMLMSLYGAVNHVCLMQRLIDKKTNEIAVGYQMIDALALQGSVVTADAMSCQVKFVDSILAAGADYTLSLKGNQDKSWAEVQNIFATADDTLKDCHVAPVELDHGRIEQRTIEVLPGHLLSDVLKNKWSGLDGGCIVRVRTRVSKKSTGIDSDGYLYYISSIAFAEGCAEKIGQTIRTHWSIENNLHYMLDVFWHQDRMQAKNANYITNRSALNKLALALLEHYCYWLWNTGRTTGDTPISIHQLQGRCRKPEVAIECLAAGFGLLQ